MAIKKPTKKAEKIQAVREFTDRIPPRQVFWKNCDYLIQGQNDERKSVLVYYGVGGVGKTTLLKKLQSEIDEKNAELGSDVCKHIYYDFDLNKTGNMMTALEGLHQKLVELKCEFPLYDLGNFYYQMMIGKKIPEPEVKSLIDSQPTLRKWKERVTSLGDTTASISQGMSIVNSFLGIGFEFGEAVAEQVPCYKFLKAVVNFADKQAVKLIEKGKEIDDEHKEIQTKLNALITDVKNPKNLEDYLPVLFAQDVTDWLNEKDNEKRLVIFIDTYEYLVNEANAEAKEREKALWLKNDCSNFQGNDSKRDLGMVFNLDPEKTLWVIAGRDKLRWWGKEEEHFDQIEQHYVEALSKEDSNYFLSCAGIITQNLRDSIYELTEGSPFYLDACVEIYEKHMARFGKEPTMEDFGGSRDKVIERMINKYTDALTRDWIIGLCALEVWTDEMAYKIFPALSPTIYKEQIKNFSYISANKFNPGKYNFDRTVQRLLFDKYSQEHIELYKDIRDRANVYFDGMFDKKEKIGKDASFSLEQWAKIISRLTNDADELQTQFETHLYNVLKSLDWKMYNVKANIVETFFNRAVALTTPDTLPYAYFLYQYGKVKRNKNEYKVAYEYMRSAYEIFAKLLGNEHEYSMKALYSLAKMADYAGHQKEALELLEKYVVLGKKIFGVDNEKVIQAMNDLAADYYYLKQHEKTLSIFQEIFTIVIRKYPENDDIVLKAKEDVAKQLQFIGKEKEGDKLYKEILETRRKNFLEAKNKLNGIADEDLLKQIADEAFGALLSTSMLDENNFKDNIRQAVCDMREVVDIYKKVLGMDNERTLEVMENFASEIGVHDGYEDEMVNVRKEIVDIHKNIYGNEDERTVNAIEKFLISAPNSPEYESLIDDFNEELLKIEKNNAEELRKYYGEADKKTIDALDAVEYRLEGMGREDEALSIRREILEICQKNRGDKDEITLKAMDFLAFSLYKRGKYDEELKLRRKILEIRKTMKCDKRYIISAINDVTSVLENLERFEDIVKLNKEALEFAKSDGNKSEILEAKEELATSLHKVERYAEELPLRAEIFEAYQKDQGDAFHETIKARINLAAILHLLGRDDEAINHWKNIANIRSTNMGDDIRETVKAKFAVTYLLLASGKVREAIEYQKQTVNTLKKAEKRDSNDFLDDAEDLEEICSMAEFAQKLGDKTLYDEVLNLVCWIGTCDRHGYEHILYIKDLPEVIGVIEKVADKLCNNGMKEVGESYKLQADELKQILSKAEADNE